MCTDYGIEHYSPLYSLNDKEKVKFLASTLGVPIRSLDSSCLFEERPLQVKEEHVADYVNRKREHIDTYIAMSANLASRPVSNRVLTTQFKNDR